MVDVMGVVGRSAVVCSVVGVVSVVSVGDVVSLVDVWRPNHQDHALINHSVKLS